jgi:predicted TIM-barrel fold metal-dependent hydrolase
MKQTILRFSLILCINAMFIAGSFAQADSLLLKNFMPVSIYNIPKTVVSKAAFPAIDMHSHDYAETQADIDNWVKTMDSVGMAKTLILTYSTGKSFDSAVDKYKRYPTRFEIWCGFDYTGFGTPGWEKRAVAELERCYKKGARGVGELGDKGEGELYSKPTPGVGVHIDNPAMKPLLQKCGELKMPVSIHISEDAWMYANPDSTNDGLMNADKWHVNMNKPGKLDHDQLMVGLATAVGQNPKTIFIACHLANCCANLEPLGKMFDKYPNFYADIAARMGEISPVPKYSGDFITKYQDRFVFGTDNGMDAYMYRSSFHILESADEHFYEVNQYHYHWALFGLHLSKEVLKKVYQTNAEKILNHK